MREALLIFRKDVRHLWPRSVPLLAVTALWGWMECGLIANPVLGLLRGVWLLWAAFLGASAIHQEQLSGHQQYWLTRPYSRRHLLLAKGLFLAIFAVLPVLVMQAVSLSVNGLPPLRYVPLLLSTALIFAGGAALIVAALASVTGNLVQLLWGFLPAAGVVILGFVVAGTKDNTWRWDGLEWIRNSALAAVVLAASIAVLLLQYSLRKTAASRCLLGGAILIAATGPFLGTWHGAWAIECTLSGRQLDGAAARMAFDPAIRPTVSFADAIYSPHLGEAGINLPILVTGIPAGTEVVSERIAARIDAPGGNSWTSEWTRVGGVYSARPLEDPRVIRGDGHSWQYVNVDEAFYRAVKDTPVHVHTTVALTLLGERKTAPLATRDRTRHLPDEGICHLAPGPFQSLMVFCAWPARAPVRSYVLARSLRNGQSLASLLTTGFSSPYSMDGSVWERASTLFSPPPEPLEMQLETWQAVARFDRELDLPQIRLADYVVRRITDMP
jgi:hypothetical protein